MAVDIDASAGRVTKSHRPAWQEKPSAPTQATKALVLAIICVCALYPIMSVVATSLSSQAEISKKNGLVLWPAHPTLDAYRTILSGGIVTDALVRSLLITFVGTLAAMTFTILMAYGLSRRGLVGGRIILTVALLTMLFTAGIIPNFLLIKQLGLLNHYAAVVLPTMMSAFNLVIVRAFFMQLPQDMFEAARMDGAGDIRILLRLVLPLSKGVIAVISLFYAVSYWNNFFTAMLYLDSSKWPLPMVLRQYVLLGQPMGDSSITSEISAPSQAIQMAVVVISLIPVVIAFPFVQRFFTKGVLTGAIKG